MMKIIDQNTWNRKEHFAFFSRMASPFFGITTEVDCTRAYDTSKKDKTSFFACYMHCSLTAVNAVEEFRYRIVNSEVVEFPIIHAGSTIGRTDGTFGLIFAHYSPDFNTFNDELQKEILAIRSSTGLRLNGEDLKKDLVRYSTIPWTSFTAILHPTNLDPTESVPKITFGKISDRNGRKYLPISVEAQHGLMDGAHIARFLEEFQARMDGFRNV